MGGDFFTSNSHHGSTKSARYSPVSEGEGRGGGGEKTFLFGFLRREASICPKIELSLFFVNNIFFMFSAFVFWSSTILLNDILFTFLLRVDLCLFLKKRRGSTREREER